MERKRMLVLSVGDFDIRKLESKIGSIEISFNAIICRRNLLVFAKEFAAALGFRNTNKAIIDHTDPEDITTIENVFGENFKLVLEQFLKLGGNESLPPNFSQDIQGHQKLLYRPAIYALCLGSKLPGVKPFRRWVYDLIDQVLETGSYTLSSSMQQLSIRETPVEKIKSTFKDIPDFEFGGDNTEREGMSSTFREGKDLSKHLGKSKGGTIGGTERDRRDKSRIKLLIEIYNSEDLKNENLREKLERIVTTQKLLEIEF